MWGRILSVLTIVGFLYYLDFVGQSKFGAFTEFTNSQIGDGFERRKEGAGAIFEISSTIVFLLYLIFHVFLNRNSFEIEQSKKIHSIRRIGALLIDFAALVPCVTISLIIALLCVEAVRTGNFEWSFIRETRASTDGWYEVAFGFGSFYLFCYYFYWHLQHQIPTIGQHILGFMISHKEPLSKFNCGVYIFSAAMHIPLLPIVMYKSVVRNVAWWDRQNEVEAVAIKATSKIFRTPWRKETDQVPSE